MTPHESLPRTVAHIPWGYGRTRVTAMPVDPERICVYWEITDETLERGRGHLGPGGAEAVLVLRIHDTTVRIFDGSASHAFHDIVVERSDRQWFATLGRPHSSSVVELGLRAPDGSWRVLARSRRVDFPRRDPVPAAPVRWGVAGRVIAVSQGPEASGTDSGTDSGTGSTPAAGRLRIRLEETMRPHAVPEAGPATGGGSEERPGGRAPGGASEERLEDRRD